MEWLDDGEECSMKKTITFDFITSFRISFLTVNDVIRFACFLRVKVFSSEVLLFFWWFKKKDRKIFLEALHHLILNPIK